MLRWVSGYVVQCNWQSSPCGLLSKSNFFPELTNLINFIDSSSSKGSSGFASMCYNKT